MNILLILWMIRWIHGIICCLIGFQLVTYLAFFCSLYIFRTLTPTHSWFSASSYLGNGFSPTFSSTSAFSRGQSQQDKRDYSKPVTRLLLLPSKPSRTIESISDGVRSSSMAPSRIRNKSKFLSTARSALYKIAAFILSSLLCLPAMTSVVLVSWLLTGFELRARPWMGGITFQDIPGYSRHPSSPCVQAFHRIFILNDVICRGTHWSFTHEGCSIISCRLCQRTERSRRKTIIATVICMKDTYSCRKIHAFLPFIILYFLTLILIFTKKFFFHCFLFLNKFDISVFFHPFDKLA